ncbi:DNA mismatch repair endonuclease MutL [Desulfuromonas acetoxidans]|uniref:DNA mismatch repair protein MutL n=1 Tax=Desulfuromonas acetoxidans (strain DSM 684 / 11070) TaxID=281689 RepID=Q1JVP7_DESA6|nr:DNA mismatch repair endonuclease MutL [Desulfuromonas acetoxidans]EAT14302.1 DNA mismatch repair protein MutL [Desulfuromonas acetoxidans DSM 684]MBF0645076.1 DNA mismatch repair endonuclease MutL [Desulfuromonas acetoxidans]NVD23115.1 DNA mismatch repair endonuclease MutL [Desulfuromonas acetoxidans]NVE15644.1 DNA mismatch repair endonuclease MutL [Desulfuromonas acetoxidans]
MPQNNRIAILPETLCNQIAAGEVVERPASVVKELVENALDAQATEVTVDVERGGKKKIRVSDNGFGMSKEDLFLCFERHATSKIRSEKDLFHLSSLGFRGEALPSIAAVSRLAVVSGQAGEETGNRLELVAGEVRHHEPEAASVGTRFEIRDLFFNLPARRKFLRRDETEFGHIAEIITRLSLAHPHVHFRLIHNQRTILDLYRQKSLKARVADVLGRSVVEKLIDVDCGDDRLHLSGFIGDPTLNRSSTQGIYSFINGRFVKDRVLQHAILDGYRHLLMKGRYPMCVLFLALEPEKVDVNVHPTKHEVRFHDQRGVHDFVSTSLRQQLRRHQDVPVCDGEPKMAPAVAPPAEPVTQPDLNLRHVPAPSSVRSASVVEAQAAVSMPLQPPAASQVRESFPAYDDGGKPPVSVISSSPVGCHADGEKTLDLEESSAYFSTLRIIGQFHRSYILCEDGDDLVLIDQHAAHERIGFERLKNQLAQGSIEQQELLFPEVIELNLREDAELQDCRERFESMGFVLEPFGGTSWAVKAVPAYIEKKDIKTMVCDMLTDFSSVGSSDISQQAIDEVLIKMACHGMIRANQTLQLDEMVALLHQLDDVDFNRHCPHGRPVMQRLTLHDVEKMFRRV